VQLLSSEHPSVVMQDMLLCSEQDVAVPAQAGIPEPVPPRSHQPESLQTVRLGQSVSTVQLRTHNPAPIHMLPSPKDCLQVSLDAQDIVHCLCPT
jgi:hypothetical protein